MSEAKQIQTELFVNKQETTQVLGDGVEIKGVAVSFTFDPNVFEMVKTRDGGYLIRKRKV